MIRKWLLIVLLSFRASEPVVPLRAGDLAPERQAMVERQIAARDVRDACVLTAMREVPRHEFVPVAPGRVFPAMG